MCHSNNLDFAHALSEIIFDQLKIIYFCNICYVYFVIIRYNHAYSDYEYDYDGFNENYCE